MARSGPRRPRHRPAQRLVPRAPTRRIGAPQRNGYRRRPGEGDAPASHPVRTQRPHPATAPSAVPTRAARGSAADPLPAPGVARCAGRRRTGLRAFGTVKNGQVLVQPASRPVCRAPRWSPTPTGEQHAHQSRPPELRPECADDGEPRVNTGSPELQPTDSGNRLNRNPGPPERRSDGSAQGSTPSSRTHPGAGLIAAARERPVPPSRRPPPSAGRTFTGTVE